MGRLEDMTRMEGETIYRVIVDYRALYPNPIVIHTGEELFVGNEDPEYPGWVWCTARNEKSGWVPEDCIDREAKGAKARYDYAAIELSVSLGELLVISKVKYGWAWCTNQNNQSGWVPLTNLEVETSLLE
jgi:uncharacterized protein YgiM (DUF1202 family)